MIARSKRENECKMGQDGNERKMRDELKIQKEKRAQDGAGWEGARLKKGE